MFKKLINRLNYHSEKTTIKDVLVTYHHFWKHTFDYLGKTTRWNFWVETIVTALILGVILNINFTFIEKIEKILPGKAEFLAIGIDEVISYLVYGFQLIILLPEVAAIIRRLRSIGIKLPILIGIIVVAAPFLHITILSVITLVVSILLLLLPDEWLTKKRD